MYGDYEIIEESDGSFSARLVSNGMKAGNAKSEAELESFMVALDIAYQNGVDAGVKYEKTRISRLLDL